MVLGILSTLNMIYSIEEDGQWLCVNSVAPLECHGRLVAPGKSAGLACPVANAVGLASQPIRSRLIFKVVIL